MSVPPNPKLAAAIRAIWERSFKFVHQEIAGLDDAVMRLQRGELDEAGRAAAENAAHKLTGSLGTFGFTDASGIARELEAKLSAPAPADAPALTDLLLALRMALLAHKPADPGHSEPGADSPGS